MAAEGKRCDMERCNNKSCPEDFLNFLSRCKNEVLTLPVRIVFHVESLALDDAPAPKPVEVEGRKKGKF